jgi:hypothetical protein
MATLLKIFQWLSVTIYKICLEMWEGIGSPLRNSPEGFGNFVTEGIDEYHSRAMLNSKLNGSKRDELAAFQIFTPLKFK